MSTCALWEEQRLSRQDKEPKLRLSLETRVTEDVTVISCKGRIAYGIEAAAAFRFRFVKVILITSSGSCGTPFSLAKRA